MASPRPSRIDWAKLLARVFALDVIICRKCGGRMRVLEVVDGRLPYPTPRQDSWLESFGAMHLADRRAGETADRTLRETCGRQGDAGCFHLYVKWQGRAAA